MYSQSRDRLLVANSFMDAIDEVSLDGEWLGRRYLWDISPDVMSCSANRDRFAPDLVHVNFIEERDSQHLATLCNINGTKEGAIVSLETGAILQRGLSLPHDGCFHEDAFYVTNTGSSELLIYDAPTDAPELDMMQAAIVPIEVTNPEWDAGSQWVRGVCVSDKFILVGVTQFRGETAEPEACLAPPRLVVFDRKTKEQLGEIFLPTMSGFTNPCIYSIFLLGDLAQEEIDFPRWSASPDSYQPSIAEELSLPDSNFAETAMQPHLSANWQWSRGVDFVKLFQVGDGIQLDLAFESSAQRTFLVSGAGTGKLTQPADNARSYALPSNAEVTVEVWVPKLTPYARVGLYFVEYDLECRVDTSKFRLREGKNELRLKTKEHVDSFRIAFRLAGSGAVAIDRVQVCALTGTLGGV